MTFLTAFLMLFFLASTVSALSPTTKTSNKGIDDFAGILNEDQRTRLNYTIDHVYNNEKIEISFVILPSGPIEAWKIDNKNGILLVVDVYKHRAKIEVGSEAGKILPFPQTIVDSIILPQLNQEKIAEAIMSGVWGIEQSINNHNISVLVGNIALFTLATLASVIVSKLVLDMLIIPQSYRIRLKKVEKNIRLELDDLSTKILNSDVSQQNLDSYNRKKIRFEEKDYIYEVYEISWKAAKDLLYALQELNRDVNIEIKDNIKAREESPRLFVNIYDSLKQIRAIEHSPSREREISELEGFLESSKDGFPKDKNGDWQNTYTTLLSLKATVNELSKGVVAELDTLTKAKNEGAKLFETLGEKITELGKTPNTNQTKLKMAKQCYDNAHFQYVRMNNGEADMWTWLMICGLIDNANNYIKNIKI